MDYRYIHPLFTEDDKDNAIDYLARNMMNSGIITVSDSDNINSPELLMLCRRLIKSMYGVNTIRMANFHRVQEVFKEKYLDSLYKYLYYCNIDTKIIDIDMPYIMHKILMFKSQEEGFRQLIYFDPNIEWDLSYTTDIDRNLINPLNSLHRVFIELRNLSQYDFIREISQKFFDNKFDVDDWQRRNKMVNLDLMLLPCDNFNVIHELTKSIHKYF